LCVIDKVPRELSEDQKQALRILARHVVSQLELRRRSKELSQAQAERDRLQQELARLQKEKAAVPGSVPARKPAKRRA
jgi:GAF domain-containing protein